jgi:alanyl-tRNA synthetase
MKSHEIRKLFLDYFKNKNHKVLESFPLVPKDDPSLLWINAGMTPLKPYFKGDKVPKNPRMTSSQRCVRTNDIENVGVTPRHQTMFEMLGNFSIGDYFKKEAIFYGYDFLTNVLGLEKERLYITVYEEDDETKEIWIKEMGISNEHMLETKEDNFWDIGEGPCGPCTEIFYDVKPELGKEEFHPDNHEGERYLEIWNLVFSQYNHNKDGSYTDLPKKNIDTGAGLERLCCILQGVSSNFETDLFIPIIQKLKEISMVEYEKEKVSYHAISDHIRSSIMMIHDGEFPSNTERGYVLRRLIRRSMRFGNKLGLQEPFLYHLVEVVVNELKEVVPTLTEKKEMIVTVIEQEEKKFRKTLQKGQRLVHRKIEELKKNNERMFSGKESFKLHDTHGFPIELIVEICEEEGIKVDMESFKEELEKQRKRSKKNAN